MHKNQLAHQPKAQLKMTNAKNCLVLAVALMATLSTSSSFAANSPTKSKAAKATKHPAANFLNETSTRTQAKVAPRIFVGINPFAALGGDIDVRGGMNFTNKISGSIRFGTTDYKKSLLFRSGERQVSGIETETAKSNWVYLTANYFFTGSTYGSGLYGFGGLGSVNVDYAARYTDLGRTEKKSDSQVGEVFGVGYQIAGKLSANSDWLIDLGLEHGVGNSTRFEASNDNGRTTTKVSLERGLGAFVRAGMMF